MLCQARTMHSGAYNNASSHRVAVLETIRELCSPAPEKACSSMTFGDG